MAKASDRKALRTEEYACCLRVRTREMEAIALNYLSFPVIKKIVCPTCKMILPINVYTREEAENWQPS
jgi:hypothetical protein